MKCPLCNGEIQYNSNYCVHCGMFIPKEWYQSEYNAKPEWFQVQQQRLQELQMLVDTTNEEEAVVKQPIENTTKKGGCLKPILIAILILFIIGIIYNIAERLGFVGT